ncbi:conserved Plasmodium protein, unknown function [Plasmodium ovale curtisi]|uniref:Uncharacterized protein n=1 Tax=Plasmodium ovale curtisi TaxID=864141 RepID=A0A1A8WHV3_PLAOA|nr:conserved Plasmodium protein, unknown function [Plasmodium ovale curtisi]SBS92508.1 conserved Plasmodium protein, unknown function [Plasmodium ovale curtisi]
MLRVNVKKSTASMDVTGNCSSANILDTTTREHNDEEVNGNTPSSNNNNSAECIKNSLQSEYRDITGNYEREGKFPNVTVSDNSTNVSFSKNNSNDDAEEKQSVGGKNNYEDAGGKQSMEGKNSYEDTEVKQSVGRKNSHDDAEVKQLAKRENNMGNPLSNKTNNHKTIHIQQNEASYEERTKYNKKKSSFYDHHTIPNNYPAYFNNYNDNSGNSHNNYDSISKVNNVSSELTKKEDHNPCGGSTPSDMHDKPVIMPSTPSSGTPHLKDGTKGKKFDNVIGNSREKPLPIVKNHEHCDKVEQSEYNVVESCPSDNLQNFRLCQQKETAPGEAPEEAEKEGGEHTGEVYNTRDKTSSTGYEKYDIHVNNEGDSYNYNLDAMYEDFYVNREKAMSHTKIFDYVESENSTSKVNRQRNKINDFVPKYKNISAKEAHYNSLSGNDNITILEANKMKLDLSKLPEKKKESLPDVYPFHLSNDCKNDKRNSVNKSKTPLEKLYPTNFTYINNYSKNNADITVAQRREYMNSSHIFDCDYDYNYEKDKKFSEEKRENVHDVSDLHTENTKKDIDMEKLEKRKLYPLYSDLFGRKTPDINQNVHCKKIMPTTMNCNWMYCPIDSKKYSDPLDKTSDYFQQYGKENFHRKSFFDKDGYDCRKKLQEAIQKGSRASLQVHLQSFLHNRGEEDNGSYYNLKECNSNNVEVNYLSLHNLTDSVSDDQIKEAVKKSQSYIVTYEPEYDFFCNRRKSNAKLCIRHSNGQEGLNILITSLSELGIKAQVLW